MRFSHVFIDRPIFATVLSVLITIIGAISYVGLPIAQYPEIAPPTIVVRATYPGASADVASDTVAAPLEQEINGVENALYIVSQSTGDGTVQVTITFGLGTDLDAAQVLVQNRVATAEARLPEEVRRLGVTTVKNSPNIMMVVNLLSPDDSLDQLYISNYATIQVKDVISRLSGVGQVQVFGARDYAMRIWLDPDRMAELGLSTTELVEALRSQNVQVASGVLGQSPAPTNTAFQLSVTTLGRLLEPGQFENIVIKTGSDGRVTRVRDVARVELGAQDYTSNSYLDDKTAVALGIFQRPGSNALSTADEIIATMERLKASFPKGLDYRIVYNPTNYIAQSVEEVEKTIHEAVALVVLVVILFLKTWRAAVIPIVAIPISLIGTFGVMAAFGFSLNTLSLFGLVLAIGIVVDDAIVVVENVERNLREGMTPKDAAHRTMDEVGGALLAIALVLSAVFIPTAFVSGIQGQFYKQFAVTIAAATIISATVSLTLSPALAALLLKPHEEGKKSSLIMRPVHGFFRLFDAGFDRLNRGYGALTKRLVRLSLLVLVAYVGLLALTGWQLQRTPTGFIPEQDQGYFITAVQLPPGASLQRTDAVLQEIIRRVRQVKGVDHTVAFAGFDGATFTNAPNGGAVFVTSLPFEEREKEGIDNAALLGSLRQAVASIEDAFIFVIAPPPVPGIGTGGGFKGYIEDQRGRGLAALEEATGELIGAANQTPGLAAVFTLFNTRTPKVYADIDRVKAEMLGVPVQSVFDTLETYLGSRYVNDFNLLGRTWRVTAQADAPFRDAPGDITKLRVPNNRGEMVPLGSIATIRDMTGPYRVPRYQLYPASELQGSTAPGFSSGQSLIAVENLAKQILPEGFAFEWTELAFQERSAGNSAVYVFGASIVFVFLLLAALYESWLLPLAVILIVPLCILAALFGVSLRGIDNNILTQVGLVVLIGLAAKSAILIVEFAKQEEEKGKNRFDAAIEAAHTRLRPILMTSLAFILGVVPLVVAKGAGAEMRQTLGTAVFSGMIGVTIFGLLFTPVFYVVTRWFAFGDRKAKEKVPEKAGGGPDPAPQPAE